MSMLSLGIIETIGLASAIDVADVMVKSANISLIGYELSKGGGMVTVKIEGNVGAVNAAISAAKSTQNKIVSFKVIPRPSDTLELLVRNHDTVGYQAVSLESPVEEKMIQPEPTQFPIPKADAPKEAPVKIAEPIKTASPAKAVETVVEIVKAELSKADAPKAEPAKVDAPKSELTKSAVTPEADKPKPDAPKSDKGKKPDDKKK